MRDGGTADGPQETPAPIIPGGALTASDFVPGVEAPDGLLDDDSDVLVFACGPRRRLVVRDSGGDGGAGGVDLPALAEMPSGRSALYLGSFIGGPYAGRHAVAVAWDDDSAAEVPKDLETRPLRSLVWQLDEPLFWVAGRAVQVVDWSLDHRYCGRCGAVTSHQLGERSKVCEPCGLAFYPRIAPAVIVLVERGDHVLLGRSSRLPDGMYSTLAGFVEPGESLEQAVVREVEEEVGVRVHRLRYFGSQPWPFPNSLMVGFRAEYAEGDLQVDETELLTADWFRYDGLPKIPPRLSIARALIDAFLAER
ncbi:MAG: NAD(+) diphosphatase [Acidobacteriota bacterium]